MNKDSLSNLLAGLGITKAFIDSTPVNNGFDYEVGIVQYDCFDTAVSLSFNIDVLCESFAPEADEFRIISGTDTIARPIVGYEYTCQPDLTVSSVKLKLHRPLDVNGDYYLQVQKGSDGNTLTNRCGFELQEFYTMIIRVSNCPQLNYELENVSVAEDEHTTLNWWVDPQSFTPETEKLFNQWNILRAKANEAPFYTIARLSKATDVNTRSYTDTSLTAFDVDKNPFRYRVQLVQNHDFKAPTNQVRSILLTDTLNEDGTAWNLYWTHYNGWQAPTFELFKAKVDSSLPAPQWENMAGPDSNFYKATFLKPKPLTQEASGLYVVKVEASDMLNPANSFISESNWIYFELKIDPEDPPVEEPVVPNVFTPNNDDNNDEFFVKAPGFKRANIEVYNRWGTLVHRSSEDVENGETLFWNGTDFNSGGDLADGVYYYVINLEGANAEDSETLQGQVNIFKN
ncbi:MAG: gliding motility-associated C-terminal domain-containing protein [Owenweeksia sp.]|nr:gliding motility-associated C-terminal domain-containing protein [Owenweeksia sp.]